MGLDIYVGSLTRYFSGDWETADAKQGDALRLDDEDEDETDDDDDETDPADVRQEVLEWRLGLNAALREHLKTPLDWNEDPDSPYFTDTPSGDCFGSLLLWAAYAENGGSKPPARVVKKWYNDSVFKRSTGADSKTLFPNLMYACEWWLPCELPGVMEVDFQDDEPFNLGSSIQLKQELEQLNLMTWKASPATLSRWHQQGTSARSSLEENARFAMAVLTDLTEK